MDEQELAEVKVALAKLETGQQQILQRLDKLDGSPTRIAVLETRVDELTRDCRAAANKADKLIWWLMTGGAAAAGTGAAGGHLLTRIISGG